MYIGALDCLVSRLQKDSDKKKIRNIQYCLKREKSLNLKIFSKICLSDVRVNVDLTTRFTLCTGMTL